MDEKQLAMIALEFLKRVELKGAEVPQYAAVHNWLESKRQSDEEEAAQEDLEAAKDQLSH